MDAALLTVCITRAHCASSRFASHPQRYTCSLRPSFAGSICLVLCHGCFAASDAACNAASVSYHGRTATAQPCCVLITSRNIPMLHSACDALHATLNHIEPTLPRFAVLIILFYDHMYDCVARVYRSRYPRRLQKCILLLIAKFGVRPHTYMSQWKHVFYSNLILCSSRQNHIPDTHAS